MDTKSTRVREITKIIRVFPSPALGRMVHYGVDGTARAAIITDVDMLSLSGRVILTVFPPGEPSFSVDARYSKTLRDGCWSWPSGL